MKKSHILPTLMATMTRHPRQIVMPGIDFEWDNGNSRIWQIFRAYEYLFGRKEGIRFEGGVTFTDKICTRSFGTWENLLVFTEGVVRAFFKGAAPKFRVVYVPQLVLANGGTMDSYFRFAIAYDNSGGGAAVANVTTVSLAVTGSNTYLTAALAEGSTTSNFISATYNAVSMTNTPFVSIQSGYGMDGMYLAGPATGTHNFVGTVTSGFGGAVMSHSGVTQAAPDGTYTATSASTSITININTATANCWGLFYALGNNGASITAGTNATGRILQNSSANLPSGFDSNGTITTGGFNMTANGFSAQPIGAVGYSVAQVAATTVLPYRALMGVGI